MPEPTPVEQIEAALADMLDAYAELRERYIRNPEDFHALKGNERDIAIEVATYRNSARLLREHRTEDAMVGLPSWLWNEWAALERGIVERLEAAADLLRSDATLTDAAKISSPESRSIDPEAVADEFGIQGLAIEDGTATLTTVPTSEQARELVLAMSLACGRMLDDDQATNYVEFEVSPANRPGYVVHVRRAAGPTPHTLRKKAEARIETAARLIRAFVDPVSECQFDHHGDCQAHGFTSIEPGELCPNEEAQRWLAPYAQEVAE